MAKIQVNYRFDPEIKELAAKIAKLERRSVSNLMEILVLERGKNVGIEIPDPEARS